MPAVSQRHLGAPASQPPDQGDLAKLDAVGNAPAPAVEKLPGGLLVVVPADPSRESLSGLGLHAPVKGPPAVEIGISPNPLLAALVEDELVEGIPFYHHLAQIGIGDPDTPVALVHIVGTAQRQHLPVHQGHPRP